ncbi:hypothetical protein [Streptomyces sp. NPDC048361]
MSKPLEPAMKGRVKTVLILRDAELCRVDVVRVLSGREPHKRPGQVNLS